VLLLLLAFVAPAASTSAAGAPPQPVATATPSLSLQVRAGFDGYYKVGGWLPVEAIATNEGQPVVGTISLHQDSASPLAATYGVTASLPTHSRKLLSFTAPALTGATTRTVVLSQGSRTLLEQSISLSPLSRQDFLYGVVSPSGTALDILRGRRQFGGAIAVAHLSLNDYPTNSSGLSNADVLLLDNVATTSLSTEQRQALTAWVDAGGQLILAGGLGAAQTIAGLTNIAPVELAGSETVDARPALTRWGSDAADSTVLVALSRPVAGAIVRLRLNDVPLVVDRPLGRGWVTFVALGATAPALTDGAGAVALWDRILVGNRATPGGVLAANVASFNGPPGNDPVYYLPQTVLPSGRLLALLIFSYVLTVGPISYVALGRIDRRELLWITIPVISLLFSAGSYALARQIKGTDIIINTVTVATSSQQPAATQLQSSIGVFSPGRATYDVRLDADLAVAPLELRGGRSPAVTILADGGTVSLGNVTVEKWTIQAFRAIGVSSSPPPLETSLTLSGTTVSGWIRNVSAQPLEDVLLAIGGDTATLPELQPGQQREVRVVLSGAVLPLARNLGLPPAPGGNTVESRRRQSLVDSVLNGGGGSSSWSSPSSAASVAGVAMGPRVLAFSSSPPFPVAVQGHRAHEHDLTLHVVSVPIATDSGQVGVPYGFARRDLLENSGIAPPLYTPWLPLGSVATFQFTLPINVASTRWTALHLRVAFPGGANGPAAGASGAPIAIALFNWSADRWDVQPGFGAGTNTVAQPGLYVDARGLLRVQFTGGNGRQNLQTLDVDAAGVRP